MPTSSTAILSRRQTSFAEPRTDSESPKAAVQVENHRSAVPAVLQPLKVVLAELRLHPTDSDDSLVTLPDPDPRPAHPLQPNSSPTTPMTFSSVTAQIICLKRARCHSTLIVSNTESYEGLLIKSSS